MAVGDGGGDGGDASSGQQCWGVSDRLILFLCSVLLSFREDSCLCTLTICSLLNLIYS